MNNIINSKNYADKFKDSVASKTSWEPLRKGGASFKTHKMMTESPYRIEFKPSVYAIIFYTIFILLGLWLATTSIYEIYFGEYFSLLELVVGCSFLGVGSYLLFTGTKPIVFDKSQGFFWTGYKKPNYLADTRNLKQFSRLIDIYALQILKELVKGNKRSYYSYELNLVFRDGSRKNVIDHGNIESLRKDAQGLSRFLNRPVWDNT